MIYKTLQEELKIMKHEPYKRMGWTKACHITVIAIYKIIITHHELD